MSKIDRLVGQRIFGWAINESENGEPARWATPCETKLECQYHNTTLDSGPHFSTEIAVAWRVREECNDKGLSFGIHDHHGIEWECSFMEGCEVFEARHESAPTAICLSALRAVGVPESEIQEAMR